MKHLLLENVWITIVLFIFGNEVCAQNCGRSSVLITGFTAGGQVAEQGAWPWMAAIMMRDKTGTFSPLCSSFFISRRHAISAAHCFDRKNTSLYVARVGNVDPKEGKEYGIVRIAIPQTYVQGRYYDDIALLTLSRDVDIPNFNPICLPPSREFRNITGKNTTVAGWGATRIGITFPEVEAGPNNLNQNCSSGTKCVEISRCRASAISSIVGEVKDCGYTINWRRKICCPQRTGASTPPRTQAQTTPDTNRRPPEGTPINVTPSSESGNSNTGCGKSSVKITGFIMGGEEAKQGAWPWMAAILMRDRTGTFAPWCTGFMISRRHAISAAHCFHRKNAALYVTRIGNIDPKKGEEYSIVQIAVPQTYVPKQYYDDLAVLTLSRDVDIPNFNPICLPPSREFKNITGRGTTVTGWGATISGGPMSLKLRQLSAMPVVSNYRCNKAFEDNLSNFVNQFPEGITPGFICAGFMDERGRDSCGGDSGGPLMYLNGYRWHAVGVVSFGYDCGRLGYPGDMDHMDRYGPYLLYGPYFLDINKFDFYWEHWYEDFKGLRGCYGAHRRYEHGDVTPKSATPAATPKDICDAITLLMKQEKVLKVLKGSSGML
ncbi:clotting factor B [Nephila pilipes]|uniref:Clotting factor B n=1 Tax=Nephila pilipes TaxID=299642 RepID=A0A8X6PBB9_NEPPI|nr:clotting factor B [Nephila pilipes]